MYLPADAPRNNWTCHTLHQNIHGFSQGAATSGSFTLPEETCYLVKTATEAVGQLAQPQRSTTQLRRCKILAMLRRWRLTWRAKQEIHPWRRNRPPSRCGSIPRPTPATSTLRVATPAARPRSCRFASTTPSPASTWSSARPKSSRYPRYHSPLFAILAQGS